MGWNDHEPWFSMIEDRCAELVDEGMSIDEAYAIALDDATDTMRERLGR